MTIQKILLSLEPKKENVLAALHRAEEEFGCVTKEHMYLIAEYFRVKPARVAALISGSEIFSISKPPRLKVEICGGPHCKIKRSNAIVREAEKYLGVKIDRKGSRKAVLKTVNCVGHCAHGPVMIVNGTMYDRVKSFDVDDILRNYL